MKEVSSKMKRFLLFFAPFDHGSQGWDAFYTSHPTRSGAVRALVTLMYNARINPSHHSEGHGQIVDKCSGKIVYRIKLEGANSPQCQVQFFNADHVSVNVKLITEFISFEKENVR